MTDTPHFACPPPLRSKGQRRGSRLAHRLLRPFTGRMGDGANSNARRACGAHMLDPVSDACAALMATMVPPDTAVIEFGAGRMVLGDLIPSTCSYTPCDLMQRSSGTIGRGRAGRFPALTRTYDYAVFPNDLHQVSDLDQLAANLAPVARGVIAAYTTQEREPPLSRPQYMTWRTARSAGDFVRIFARQGFLLREAGAWDRQTIFRFDRPVRPDRY